MKSAVAIDIGHSAVKVAVSDEAGKRHILLFPTAVCKAFKISNEIEAARAAKETVRIGTTEYFVGETALIQGGATVTTGLSEDWLKTPEYSALMVHAYNEALKLADSANPSLVLGLPTHLYSRQEDKAAELAIALLSNSDVRVIPQPMGVYFEAMISEDGSPLAAIETESWAVIEIGYFTTDFMLMKKGRWAEKASGVCSGARVAAEHLQRILGEKNITVDLYECEEALRIKQIKNFGNKIDVSTEVNEAVSILVNEVVDTATRLMESEARKTDGFIIAGGGAGFMFSNLKERFPNAIMPQTPRMSVVEGMRRCALMFNKHN